MEVTKFVQFRGHLFVEGHRLHRDGSALGSRHGESQVADVPRQVEDHIGGPGDRF